MKHFLIAVLLAAIGAVAFVGNAHAASRYCKFNPEDPACYDQGGGYDDGYDDGYDRPQPLYDGPGYDDGRYPRPRPPKFRPVDRCTAVGQSLRRYGYRHIRPLDCGGKNLKFEAFRGYQRFIVKVKASNGRIIYEIGG